MMRRFRRLGAGRRFTVVSVICLIVFAGVFAIAASLNVSTQSLGAGSTSVSSCDTDGVTTDYTPSYSTSAPGPGYVVSSVSVTGINRPGAGQGCDGKTLNVTVTKADGTGNVSGTATINNTSMTVSLGSAVLADNIEKVFATIYG